MALKSLRILKENKVDIKKMEDLFMDKCTLMVII